MTTKKASKELGARSLPELVHSIVEKGANSTEEIHRQIAGLPVKILEGLMPETAHGVDKIQHRSIGAVYDTIRRVNDEVERLADEVLDEVVKARRKAKPRPASKRATARAKRKWTPTAARRSHA